MYARNLSMGSPEPDNGSSSLSPRPVTGRQHAIRVVVVDDHQLISDVLAAAMRSRDEFEFCGSVARLADLPGLYRIAPPDVALVDARLPDGSGIEALRNLRRRWPRTRLVMFTGMTEPGLADEAVAAGADGLISKEHGVIALLDLIRRAAGGEVLFPLELLQRLSRGPRPSSLNAVRAQRLLSARERASLQAIVEFGSLSVAATQLQITEGTLKNHLHSAISKLGASTRMEGVSIAWRLGLIEPPRS